MLTRTALLILATILLVAALEHPDTTGGFNTVQKHKRIEAASRGL